MAKVIMSNLTSAKAAVVKPDTLEILNTAADKAGIERIFINSTLRTPAEQAYAMYVNISSGRIIRYKEPGQKVTQLCLDMLNKKCPKSEILEAMAKLIADLADKGQRVSRHCVSDEAYEKNQIIDVSRSILHDKAVKFIKALKEDERVDRIIQPISGTAFQDLGGVTFDSSEPAIHIEILL